MFSDAVLKIEDRFNTLWADTAISWDNVKYNPTRGVPFIRVQVEWAGSEQITTGPRIRGDGFILVAVFSPYRQGTSPALGLADNVATLMNMWQSGNLTTKVATIERIGQNEEWYQVNVLIPFIYDECV